MKRSTITFTVALTILLSASAANAANAGFLSDYSKLQSVKGDENERSWVVPDAETRALKYTSIMIDQPEVFISPNSKYKGAKPDDLKTLADELRNRLREELERSGKYKVVNEPAADVLYLRVAITDLMLQKKKRPVVAYTPVGAVVHGARKLVRGTTDGVDLTHAKIEAELSDSVTSEPLSAYVLIHRSDSDLSWDELTFAFSGAGKRIACRLENARVPEEQRQACQSIPVTTKSTD